MRKQFIGFVIVCFGAMMGDSDKLLLPLAITLVGAILIFAGSEKGE